MLYAFFEALFFRLPYETFAQMLTCQLIIQNPLPASS